MPSPLELADLRLPRSAVRRGALTYAKLLRSVDAQAKDGFGFRGTFFRPGQKITRAELRPDDRWPRVPVLLECAGPLVSRRAPPVYILWRLESATWSELARSSSHDASWAVDLAPIAWRAIEQSKPAVDVAALAARIRAVIDEQLVDLSADEKRRVLTLVHDHTATLALLAEEERVRSLATLAEAVSANPETVCKNRS